MKKGYIFGILLFALAVCGVAFLSEPDETTRIALLLDNHELKRAEELLRKQYERDPGNLDVAAKLADTLRSLKEFSAAKKIVQTVLRGHPGDIPWKRRLALILLAENDPEAADRVLPPKERDASFWGELARSYHDLSRDDEAEKALFAAHAEDTDKADVWRILAAWRAERNDFHGEKEALETALRLAPGDTDLFARYFRNRARAGDLKSALWASQKLPQPLEREFLEALYRLYCANNDYQGAQRAAEQLITLKDTIPADKLALASSLYFQKNFAGALAALDELSAHSEKFSQAVRAAIVSQTRDVRLAMLLEGAKNGKEQPLINEIGRLRAGTSEPDPEFLRQLLYACLQLSDFHKAAAETAEVHAGGKAEISQNRAQFWLDEAKSIFDQNKDALSPDVAANARLAADLAERRGDWAGMMDAWNTLARRNGADFQTLLGIARASRNLHDYETAWQSLVKAEGLAKTGSDLLEVALQAQNIAGAMPDDYPGRREKLAHADGLARKILAKNWDKNLALNLFFRMLETKNLDEAERLLETLASKGLATPEEYLALAEAQTSMAGRASRNGNGSVRESAARNAQKALEGGSPEALPRLLYIFMRLDDRRRVADILQRIERQNTQPTPALLRQLAEAQGFLGNQERQSALLEQRARLTGRLEDWEEVIDQRYWRGDHQGALKLLDAAESFFPANGELRGRRLAALANMGGYRQAIKFFQSIQERDPEAGNKIPAEGLAALALAYDRSGYPDRARHFYNLALAKEPTNDRAVFGMADLSRRQGRNAEAARLLSGFIERNPKNLWARADLAQARPAEGKRQYENILAAREKGGASEKAVRALALWKTGRLDQALRAYAELMKDPGRTEAMICDYARALIDADKFEEAKRILATVISEFPRNLSARRLLAAVLIREKEYAAAETCLRKALKLAPGNTEILRDLAYVQLAQKKFWSAQKNYLGGGRR